MGTGLICEGVYLVPLTATNFLSKNVSDPLNINSYEDAAGTREGKSMRASFRTYCLVV